MGFCVNGRELRSVRFVTGEACSSGGADYLALGVWLRRSVLEDFDLDSADPRVVELNCFIGNELIDERVSAVCHVCDIFAYTVEMCYSRVLCTAHPARVIAVF